ncbi:unnamed protein product [Schistosoma mattheei]|uniref:BZIP domain-containing protein n=1 Tax=Schistosoma mattheei TaxID=31246 RepID=A0AA85BGP0_9TREM|nr:unnamed protein product [Schistosoma mattheei]
MDPHFAAFPSSASVRASEYCPSPSQSRKRYECVPEPMKKTPDYINKRIRNRSAVKRFREKSKTKAKRQEDVKAHLISLTKFYDNELVRIKHSKQVTIHRSFLFPFLFNNLYIMQVPT